MKKRAILICLATFLFSAHSALAISPKPQAVFKITNEMIRRSGYTSLPEVLRLAPGVQVAKIQSNQWAVGIRGFNQRFSNKVMVLIDDRPVNSTLFGGTFWETNSVMLEDVDYIEVIRGSVGSLFGSNAVHGVIRVVTKKSQETVGGLLTGGGGSEDQGFFGARFGTEQGETAWRFYSQAFNRDRSFHPAINPNDDWASSKSGFRIDSELSPKDTLMVTTGFQYGVMDQRLTYPSSIGATGTALALNTIHEKSLDLTSRWIRDFSENQSLTVQGSYDFWKRNDSALFESYVHVFDLNAVHRFETFANQSFSWGLRYRNYRDDITSHGPLGFIDPSVVDHLGSLFFTDEIPILPEKLILTLAGNIEMNEFTGFEYQPSGRLSWLMNDKNSWWFSIGRSVRTPTRFQDSGTLFVVNAAETSNIQIKGSKGLKSEDLVGLESGFRSQLTDSLDVDVSGFYSYTKNILTENLSGSTVTYGNTAKAKTWGGEAAAHYRVIPEWLLSAHYTLLKIDVDAVSAASAYNKAPSAAQAESPQHMATFWSRLDLPLNFQIDAGGRLVTALDQFGVDHYLVADARVAWKPTDDFTFSVAGQNLFEKNHAEFPSELFVTGAGMSRVEQSIYGKFDWTF